MFLDKLFIPSDDDVGAISVEADLLNREISNQLLVSIGQCQ